MHADKSHPVIRGDDLRCNGVRLVAMKKKREAWFKANRGRLEKESTKALAIELRRLGYYSRGTSMIDVEVSIEKTAMRLQLPTKFRSSMGFTR